MSHPCSLRRTDALPAFVTATQLQKHISRRLVAPVSWKPDPKHGKKNKNSKKRKK